MHLPLYQVDAFADRLFSGNPAAVVPCPGPLPVGLMQSIAFENNLSETAFIWRTEAEGWHIRWFTPITEVDLCGHATVASAFIIHRFFDQGRAPILFSTEKAGLLQVNALPNDRFALDFPARPPGPVTPPPRLLKALFAGRPDAPSPQAVLAARDYLVVLERADDVRRLEPDMADLARLDRMTIVTAPGDADDRAKGIDFISRFFAPAKGIPEDPATGSAHCTLAPYWSERLGRKQLRAWQASRRGAALELECQGDRVRIAGGAVLYMEGRLSLPD
jgi:PhzF family phenazine biosynthesis protein